MPSAGAHRAGQRKTRAPSRVASFRKVACLLLFVVLGMAPAGWSQASDANPGDTNQSWTATSEAQNAALGNQTRTVNSHTQSGNRTVDKQSIQILRSGTYEPYQDIERETLKVDSSTTHAVVRSYGRDSNGQRILIQVTEEQTQALPGGGSKVVRSTSNPDANGNLILVQRQVQDTTKLNKNLEETNTTTYLPGVNGGLTASMQVRERREHIDDQTVQFKKSTLLPDGEGNWQIGEVKTGTITETGKDRSSEEDVLRPDSEGHLGEVSRTVSRQSQTTSGENRGTIETYSMDVPGSSSDGSLHLVQRVTTAQRDNSNGGQTTQQQVEQINPGDPGAGLQVTVQSTDATAQGISGTQQTRTLSVRDPDGRMGAVSVDMTTSDQTPPVQVQIAPSGKPK
jgi:hypothetical protein